MRTNLLKTFASLAVIIGGFAGVYLMSGFIEKTKPVLPESYADEDLALQGARLKGYTLGFDGLLADWYWMKSLQYLGTKVVNTPGKIDLEHLESLNPRLLYPYLDNATTLDPKFMSVYEYGATVLPAIDKEQAIKLIEKGIADNPDYWRLYQYLGFIYWRLGNYEKASEIYAQGAKVKDAPDFMQMMAAKMKLEGGSRATSRAIYQQIFDEAQDEQSKENAKLRLLQLDSLDEREVIQKNLDNFKNKNNRCVNSWRELLPLLQNEKLPDGKDFRVDTSSSLVDPSGAPYLLESKSCQVKLDLKSTKIPQN